MKVNLKTIEANIYIFIIIFSTDTFIVFANTDEFVKRIFQVLVIGAVLRLMIPFLANMQNKKNQTIGMIWGMFGVLILLTGIMNGDYTGGVWIKLIVISFGLMYATKYEFRLFSELYINWMCVIALYSLVTYVLSSLIRQIPFIPVIFNGNKEMLFLGLSNVDAAPQGLSRNWGPFWEPGVYQMYLVLALLLTFLTNDKSIKKKVLLIIAVASTFSTTGYINLAIILLASFIRPENNLTKSGRVKNRMLILGLAATALIFLLVNDNILDLVFGKLFSGSASFSSTASRLNSIVINLKIFMKSPFFGVGPTQLALLYERYIKIMNSIGTSNTNGLLMNFSIFGGLFGCLYSAMLFRLSNAEGRSLVMKGLIFGSLMIMLVSEPLVNSLLFNTLIFCGIQPLRGRES